MKKRCEIAWCENVTDLLVQVNENIGDGSWRVLICQECANKIGLKSGDDLPSTEEIKRRHWIGGWVEPGDCSRPRLEEYGAYLEPLLFGKECILPELAKCINGEPTCVDVLNFTLLLRDSHLFKIAEMVYGLKRIDLE